MKQVNIFYIGRVQGIGFRFATLSYAEKCELKGWVRNLPDGRVEIVVEGRGDNIKKFCRSIEGHFDGYIKDKDVSVVDATGMYKNFKIM